MVVVPSVVPNQIIRSLPATTCLDSNGNRQCIRKGAAVVITISSHQQWKRIPPINGSSMTMDCPSQPNPTQIHRITMKNDMLNLPSPKPLSLECQKNAFYFQRRCHHGAPNFSLHHRSRQSGHRELIFSNLGATFSRSSQWHPKRSVPFFHLWFLCLPTEENRSPSFLQVVLRIRRTKLLDYSSEVMRTRLATGFSTERTFIEN